MAASVNHCEMAHWLITNGVPIDATGDTGEYAIHLAESIEMLELLIEHGSPVNPEDKTGTTPLDLALAEGKTGLAEYIASKISNESNAPDHKQA